MVTPSGRRDGMEEVHSQQPLAKGQQSTKLGRLFQTIKGIPKGVQGKITNLFKSESEEITAPQKYSQPNKPHKYDSNYASVIKGLEKLNSEEIQLYDSDKYKEYDHKLSDTSLSHDAREALVKQQEDNCGYTLAKMGKVASHLVTVYFTQIKPMPESPEKTNAMKFCESKMELVMNEMDRRLTETREKLDEAKKNTTDVDTNDRKNLSELQKQVAHTESHKNEFPDFKTKISNLKNQVRALQAKIDKSEVRQLEKEVDLIQSQSQSLTVRFQKITQDTLK